MDGNNLLERIAMKREKLSKVSLELKSHFVGLDSVIDKIITSIEAWYCMPELLTRPTIVCLWGLTGNGKTDLVRRLTKAMDFTDNFVEIQLTNKGSSQHGYSTTLQGLLSSSNVSPEEPGILLLDEIQRFRSVDEEGKDIHDYYFQDMWMLLSDGSFGGASDTKQQILEMLLEAIYWDDYNAAQNAAKKSAPKSEDDEDEDYEKQEKEIESRRKFKLNYYHARQLKKKLRLTEGVEDVMRWDTSKKMEVLKEKMNDKSIYRAEIYSKCLIFVSGNLDEAYKMANEIEETDIEADLFHKHSLRINLLSIKAALRDRFKPEQIARFGNTHVIYPSLNRSSYETIIRRKVAEVLEDVYKHSGVKLQPDDSVYDAIYRNGVFPVQGTRPVFSTISSFFESALPAFTLKSLQAGENKVKLYYDDKSLCAKIGSEFVKVPNEGDIDKIKAEKRNENQIRKVAIHETGHAITYGILFGYVPTQVAVLVASEDKNGFIGLHAIDSTKDFLMKQIICLLAGRVAEEIVFGKDNVNGGAVGDIDRATTIAANMIRLYGMSDKISRLDTLSSHAALQHNLDLKGSNEMIEHILQEQRLEAEKILRENMLLVKDMSDYLIKNEKIDVANFTAIFNKHGKQVEYLDAKETIFPKFRDFYTNFWEKQEKERGI